jgi:putative transposase
MSVSLVARQHGIAPNQVFTWRRLYAEGALSAVGLAKRWCPPPNTAPCSTRCANCSGCSAKRPWRTKCCATRSNWLSQKTVVAVALAGAGRHAVKTISDALGVARSNLAAQAAPKRARQRRGRRPQPEDELLAEIKEAIAGQATYGYRRIHALVRRQRAQENRPAVNVKRVYRVMKAHGLLLERHTGRGQGRRHDGRVAVDRPDTRWCSDGFEIGCDNGERVRIVFTLDCCDREAISWVATTSGIDSGYIRDLMVESVERRFGLVNRLPKPIEWLSDNGSPYTARETRAFAGNIGLVPCTTPIESPQSNGMAEAFVKTIKRDYARVSPRPDAASVLRQLDGWFEHYNTIHPHKALGYRSPHEFRKLMLEKTTENAVGAVRRPHENTMSADAVGSRPQPPKAVARSASLDASAAVDHR